MYRTQFSDMRMVEAAAKQNGIRLSYEESEKAAAIVRQRFEQSEAEGEEADLWTIAKEYFAN